MISGKINGGNKMKSVSDYFADDHDKIDGFFAEFRALKRQDPALAKQRFKEFLKSLTRHIVWEEEVLFPAFEKSAPEALPGPTTVMRMEHREIKKRLDAIHDKVRVGNPQSGEEEEALRSLLESHNMKEEKILYPAIDAAMGKEGIVKIEESIRAIPEERYACCCQSHHAKETLDAHG